MNNAGSHLIGNRCDDCPYSGLHALQHLTHNEIVLYQIVKDRDCRNDQKRRNNGSENCNHRSGHSGQLISHHDGPVDCNGSRRGLGDRDQIQHLLILDPVIFIYKFFLQKRNDHITAAKGKSTQVECGDKQLPQHPSFVFHF